MSHSPFPRMARIRQHFARPVLSSPPGAAAAKALESLRPAVPEGKIVGITVGSRGISNIQPILRATVEFIKSCKAVPVFLAAMGSHGGGGEAGQKEVLESLDLTEESLGAKIITCAEGRELGSTDKGWKIFMLESAFAVDAILPVNRIKTHTSFKGEVESGLAKMLTVGLGGPPGAAQFHGISKPGLLSTLLNDVAGAIIRLMPVIGGLGIIENAYEETAYMEAVPAAKLLAREPELLRQSKNLMPSLPAEKLDGLIVREIGKNFSGTGMDTNIIGRLRINGEPDPINPDIRYIAALDLSEASHGNATGIGLADFTTKRLVDKIDFKATYLNNLTTTFVTRAFVPMFFDTDKACLEAMIGCMRNTPEDELRLCITNDTLHLEECVVSEAILEELKGNDRYEVLSASVDVPFDTQGNLLPFL